MSTLYVIAGVVLYILIGGVASAIVHDRKVKMDDDPVAIVGGAFWPILPLVVVFYLTARAGFMIASSWHPEEVKRRAESKLAAAEARRLARERAEAEAVREVPYR